MRSGNTSLLQMLGICLFLLIAGCGEPESGEVVEAEKQSKPRNAGRADQRSQGVQMPSESGSGTMERSQVQASAPAFEEGYSAAQKSRQELWYEALDHEIGRWNSVVKSREEARWTRQTFLAVSWRDTNALPGAIREINDSLAAFDDRTRENLALRANALLREFDNAGVQFVRGLEQPEKINPAGVDRLVKAVENLIRLRA